MAQIFRSLLKATCIARAAVWCMGKESKVVNNEICALETVKEFEVNFVVFHMDQKLDGTDSIHFCLFLMKRDLQHLK